MWDIGRLIDKEDTFWQYDIQFERQGNVQQFSRADAIETSRLIEELSRGTENVNVHQTLKATTVEGLQQPAHDGLEKSSEFDDSSNEDYVVDQFIDDEYSMDDYVVEDEVQVDHEVGNETNTECELSATTSKKRGKRRRQEEDQNVSNTMEEDFIRECLNYGNIGSTESENKKFRNKYIDFNYERDMRRP